MCTHFHTAHIACGCAPAMDDSDNDENHGSHYEGLSLPERQSQLDTLIDHGIALLDREIVYNNMLRQMESTQPDGIYKMPSEEELCRVRQLRDSIVEERKIVESHATILRALSDRKTVENWILPAGKNEPECEYHSRGGGEFFFVLMATVVAASAVCFIVVSALEDSCVIRPLSRIFCARHHTTYCHFDDFDVDLFCNPRPLSQNLFFVDLLSRVWAWLATVSRLVLL